MNGTLALLGGGIIGGASALLWVMTGRVAGISGIAGGLAHAPQGDRMWRVLFVLGLLAGGALMHRLRPDSFGTAGVSLAFTVGGGLLVGIGTTLGGGCTSGHGVCGISRLSPRSMVATMVFMGFGALSVFVLRHLLTGAS
jgi:uncharacterized membrane protein YedE/YeeE